MGHGLLKPVRETTDTSIGQDFAHKAYVLNLPLENYFPDRLWIFQRNSN